MEFQLRVLERNATEQAAEIEANARRDDGPESEAQAAVRARSSAERTAAGSQRSTRETVEYLFGAIGSDVNGITPTLTLTKSKPAGKPKPN